MAVETDPKKTRKAHLRFGPCNPFIIMPASEDTLDDTHPDYKRIHQPWALPILTRCIPLAAGADGDGAP